MARWPKIYWIGPGANHTSLHTRKEFLDIMRNVYFNHVLYRRKGQPPDPEKIKKKDLVRWMEFSGATFRH
jgi:hypothetical protein